MQHGCYSGATFTYMLIYIYTYSILFPVTSKQSNTMKKTRISMNITPELKMRLKIQAAKEGRDVSSIIIEIIEEYLRKHEK